jgi:hypothetical protein
MVYTALGFVIAFINIEPVLQRSNLANTIWVEWLPPVSINNAVVSQQNIVQQTGSSWNINEWIIFIILAGMVVMLLRLAIQIYSVRQMKKSAEHFSENGLHFYQVNKNIIPFSFGNAIFLNKDLHTESELREVISHEFVHVKQKHNIDILWAEFLCLVNWYNPFAWLIKKAIRQNLEFIADDKVLETGIAKTQYQYLLLKVVGNNQFSIAPKFNFSSLKKRIAMMNKIKTARVHLVKFVFVLPLAAVLLFAFRKKDYSPLGAYEVKKSFLKEIVEPIDTLPLPPPPVPPVVKKIQPPAALHTLDKFIQDYKKGTQDYNKDIQEYRKRLTRLQEGFTGLQGVIINSENAEENVAPKFVNIKGKPHYYTKVGNKITYYNLNGQEIDSNGKLLSTIQTNASEVLPNQYILKVYKDGELISSFNDNKGGSLMITKAVQ